jgi:hypothetical protein
MQVGSVRVVGTALVAGCCVRLATAQEAKPLRYQPREGTVVHTVLSARATLVYRDVTGGVTAADSVVGEYTALGAIGQRVVQTSGEASTLDVRLDSLRTRARLTGQAWQEWMLVDSLRPTTRMTLDHRLRIQASPASGLGAAQVALARSVGWMGIEFPEEAVAPAGRWTAPTVVRLPRDLATLHEVVMPDSLEGVAAVVLDSIVARPADTLLFFSFQSSIGPATAAGVDAGDSASVSLAGAQAGSLIWSTAWQTFVAGSSQTKVRARLRVTSARGGREAELLWTVNGRVQVRL